MTVLLLALLCWVALAAIMCTVFGLTMARSRRRVDRRRLPRKRLHQSGPESWSKIAGDGTVQPSQGLANRTR